MKPEEKYIELYATSADRIGKGFPLSFNARRRGYIEDVALCGIPGTAEERYRYTNLNEIFSRDLTPVPQSGSRAVELYEDNRTELHNGTFLSDDQLAARTDEVIVTSLRTASVDYEQLIEQYYNSTAANKTDAMAALNSAFIHDGAFVFIPARVAAGRLNLDFRYDSPEPDGLIFSRLLVVLGEGASAEVVVSHRGSGQTSVTNHVSEFIIARDAKLTLTETTEFTAQNIAVLSSYSRVEGTFDRVFVQLGAEVIRSEYHCDLTRPGAQTSIYGLYLAAAQEKMDTYTAVNHLTGNCNSFQLIKGVVSGEAVGVFTGRIYVAPDADGTSAMQQNRNLIISPQARAVSAPQLEIYAEEVQCTHGASTGQLDPQAIYYMRQRGIDETMARKLQMSGFVNDIISRCDNPTLAAEIYEMAAAKIESL